MTNASGEWTKCSPNEITRLVGRIRARRQRRILGTSALVLAVVAAIMTIWLYPRPDEGPDFAGISCKRVGELADAYTKKQLPPDLQDQVSRHIALCPICRPMFEGMPAASRRQAADLHAALIGAPPEMARVAHRRRSDARAGM